MCGNRARAEKKLFSWRRLIFVSLCVKPQDISGVDSIFPKTIDFYALAKTRRKKQDEVEKGLAIDFLSSLRNNLLIENKFHGTSDEFQLRGVWEVRLDCGWISI